MTKPFAVGVPRWLRWAGGVLLVAAGCGQPLAMAIAAPQPPPGKARIWFYRGYEPPVGYSPASIPTIAANGTYVGPAPSGSAFYRDVPAGRYDITIPNPAGFRYEAASFELLPGQQAFVKIILNRTNINGIRSPQRSGFGALLVPEQVAEAEIPNLAADSVVAAK